MIRLILSAVFLSVCFSLPAHAQDVAGGKEHPVLARYSQSVIRWYDVQTFMPYKIAVARSVSATSKALFVPANTLDRASSSQSRSPCRTASFG